MANPKIGWLTADAVGAAAVFGAVLVYARFRRDLRAARERLKTGGRQVVETECGPIEYAASARDRRACPDRLRR